MHKILLILVVMAAACSDSSEAPLPEATVTDADTTSVGAKLRTPGTIQFDTTESIASRRADTVFIVQTFEKIPAEIDGCSGLFMPQKKSYGKGYVFATNLQGKAFIRAGGKIITLRLVSKRSRGNILNELYAGEGYRVSFFSVQSAKTGDEVWEYKGTLRIGYKGRTQRMAVYGEVGC